MAALTSVAAMECHPSKRCSYDHDNPLPLRLRRRHRRPPLCLLAGRAASAIVRAAMHDERVHLRAIRDEGGEVVLRWIAQFPDYVLIPVGIVIFVALIWLAARSYGRLV